MKKHSRPPRRSHLTSSSSEFVLDSKSAIAEFKRHKPGAIVSEGEDVANVHLEPKDFVAFCEEAKERKSDLILALDHVTDPRNLGAIVRTAAFFGVREVIVPQDRQADLSQSAVATSMGGFALCDLVRVVNLNRAIEELKEIGYWVIGADVGGQKPAGLREKYEKLVLVLGAEEKGMSKTVRDKCDVLVGIDGKGPSLQSLNVSVAAGILIAQLT